jgi:hypothetical protein
MLIDVYVTEKVWCAAQAAVVLVHIERIQVLAVTTYVTQPTIAVSTNQQAEYTAKSAQRYVQAELH